MSTAEVVPEWCRKAASAVRKSGNMIIGVPVGRHEAAIIDLHASRIWKVYKGENMSEEIKLRRGSPDENWRITSQSVYRPPPPPTPTRSTTAPTWERPAMISGSGIWRKDDALARVARQAIVRVQGVPNEQWGVTAGENFDQQMALLEPLGTPPIRCEQMSGTMAYANPLAKHWPRRGMYADLFSSAHLLGDPASSRGARVNFWDYPDAIKALRGGIADRLDDVLARHNHALLLDNIPHNSVVTDAPPFGAVINLLAWARDAAHERGLLLFANVAARFWEMTDAHIDQLAKAVDLVSLEQWWSAHSRDGLFRWYQRFLALGGRLAFIVRASRLQPGVVAPVSWRNEARFAAGVAHCLGNTYVWGPPTTQEAWGWDTGKPTSDVRLTNTGCSRDFKNGQVVVDFTARTASFIDAADSGSGDAEDG